MKKNSLIQKSPTRKWMKWIIGIPMVVVLVLLGAFLIFKNKVVDNQYVPSGYVTNFVNREYIYSSEGYFVSKFLDNNGHFIEIVNLPYATVRNSYEFQNMWESKYFSFYIQSSSDVSKWLKIDEGSRNITLTPVPLSLSYQLITNDPNISELKLEVMLLSFHHQEVRLRQKTVSLIPPTPTPFPENLKDKSLEIYLKNKVDACVEYFNENKCDKTQNYAVIQVINKNYTYGGFGNSQTGFQFAAVKINGSWTDFWTGGGGIPGCSELVNFPPGIFGDEILNSCSDGNKLIMRTTGKILFPTN